ncbi:MAG: DUF2892 domain-containing protein [Bacteroidota bacterium]|nr:DUF2892 domain-containing protein [Candidatus Kapabacteria bacterium]MCS7303404.1 DUF2892 domain-containing protein [Candidatus Kapabacteria bacterium]MCX7937410.1 DUF2892 domain-containing protein [Chlorobiota bacterium]MDW8075662.1 DUF2892 domain-containing protein [Bacteroidota bacterium]MDW8272281.1 DUF2892 domain-containing protein [Bacteroidota bacterium]
MNANMGTLDRGLRTVIAIVIAILIAAQVVTGTWAWVLGIVAAVLLITSLVSVCPLYSLLGISTCKVDTTQ